MGRTFYSEDKAKYSYDYDKQVWIVEGKYQRCGHPEAMNCNCYGKQLIVDLSASLTAEFGTGFSG